MKNILPINLLILILTISCSEKKQDVQLTENQKIEMRNAASEFMGLLKNTLINQIKSEGVLSAVDVCSDTAQVLTNEFGLMKGVYVKRVSFKNRNNNNVPDGFEAKVLKDFEQRDNEGILTTDTEYFEITKENDHNYLRYMKPIKIGAACLMCHGNEQNISPEVRALIAKRYPEDKAVDYNNGDLRGAVSIKKLIN